MRREVVEDRQIELPETRGVGDHLDLGDLPVGERDAERPKQPSTRGQDGAHRTVDERRPCELRAPRKGDRLPGPDPRTVDLARCARRHGVGTNHDVRIEHRDERVEVTGARGCEERVDDLSLTGELGVGNRGRGPPCRGR